MEYVKITLENMQIEIDRSAKRNAATFWKPLSSMWKLKAFVVVRVPLDPKYIANIPTDDIVGSLYGEKAKVKFDPVLTPKGFAYIQNELEEALQEYEPKFEPDAENWDSNISELSESEFEEI